MKKQQIKLTESNLRRIVKESVNKILKESSYNLYLHAMNRMEQPTDKQEMFNYLSSKGYKMVDQEAVGSASEGGTRMISTFKMGETYISVCWSDETNNVIQYSFEIRR